MSYQPMLRWKHQNLMLLSESDAVKYLSHKNNYPYSDSMITQQYSETFSM